MTHASIGLIEPRVFIENRTFDEIEVGESATLDRTLSRGDIELFAVMSGDVNPAHLDEEYASHAGMIWPGQWWRRSPVELQTGVHPGLKLADLWPTHNRGRCRAPEDRLLLRRSTSRLATRLLSRPADRKR